jgi:hypothetical protein
MSSASEVMLQSATLMNTLTSKKEHDQAIIAFTFFTFCLQLVLLVCRWSLCARAYAVGLCKCAAIYVANGCCVSCSAA